MLRRIELKSPKLKPVLSYLGLALPFCLFSSALTSIYGFASPQSRIAIDKLVTQHMAIESVELVFCYEMIVIGALLLASGGIKREQKLFGSLHYLFAEQPLEFAISLLAVGSGVSIGVAISTMIWGERAATGALLLGALGLAIVRAVLSILVSLGKAEDSPRLMPRHYRVIGFIFLVAGLILLNYSWKEWEQPSKCANVPARVEASAIRV